MSLALLQAMQKGRIPMPLPGARSVAAGDQRGMTDPTGHPRCYDHRPIEVDGCSTGPEFVRVADAQGRNFVGYALPMTPRPKRISAHRAGFCRSVPLWTQNHRLGTDAAAPITGVATERVGLHPVRGEIHSPTTGQ